MCMYMATALCIWSLHDVVALYVLPYPACPAMKVVGGAYPNQRFHEVNARKVQVGKVHLKNKPMSKHILLLVESEDNYKLCLKSVIR